MFVDKNGNQVCIGDTVMALKVALDPLKGYAPAKVIFVPNSHNSFCHITWLPFGILHFSRFGREIFLANGIGKCSEQKVVASTEAIAAINDAVCRTCSRNVCHSDPQCWWCGNKP